MTDNNMNDNKTEALNEETKKKELSMEDRENVTGAGLASPSKVTDSGNGKGDYSEKHWKDLFLHILKNK